MSSPRKSAERAEILAQREVVEAQITDLMRKHAERPVPVELPYSYTFRQSPLGFRVNSLPSVDGSSEETLIEWIAPDSNADLKNVVGMQVRMNSPWYLFPVTDVT